MRRRRDSGRGERLSGVIDYRGHRGRLSEISRASCISFLQIALRGRCARRTAAYSDRAERLIPNLVLSSRDSYQRRRHLTVSKVGTYGLTRPRTSTGLLETENYFRSRR